MYKMLKWLAKEKCANVASTTYLSSLLFSDIYWWILLKSISFKTWGTSSPPTFSYYNAHRVMAGPLLTQIDLRLIADPVCVINDPWQASHPKAEQICLSYWKNFEKARFSKILQNELFEKLSQPSRAFWQKARVKNWAFWAEPRLGSNTTI